MAHCDGGSIKAGRSSINASWFAANRSSTTAPMQSPTTFVIARAAQHPVDRQHEWQEFERQFGTRQDNGEGNHPGFWNARDADRGEHAGRGDHQLLTETERDAERLSHDHRGEGLVEQDTVVVEVRRNTCGHSGRTVRHTELFQAPKRDRKRARLLQEPAAKMTGFFTTAQKVLSGIRAKSTSQPW